MALAAFVALSLLVACASAQPKLPYFYPRVVECPHHPAALCDFYFDGYPNSVPTFIIDDGMQGDHAVYPELSGAIVEKWKGYNMNWCPGVKDMKTDAFVLANTMNATWMPYSAGTYDADGALKTFDQFYLNALTDAVSRLWVRSFQEENPAWGMRGIGYYKEKCAFLPFTGAYIAGTDINLNLGDETHADDYPEDRRCVVFKTSKKGIKLNWD